MKVRHIGIEKMEKKNEDDKIFLTCSNMIGQFNTKANKMLDKSVKDLKFSRNKDAFRKQIINFYSDSNNKIKDLKKEKQYYNITLNIFDENDEKRIKIAQKMEKHFYRKKLTDLLNRKKLFHHINELYKPKSKKNIKNENDKDTNYFHSSQKFLRNNSLYNNYI